MPAIVSHYEVEPNDNATGGHALVVYTKDGTRHVVYGGIETECRAAAGRLGSAQAVLSGFFGLGVSYEHPSMPGGA